MSHRTLIVLTVGMIIGVGIFTISFYLGKQSNNENTKPAALSSVTPTVSQIFIPTVAPAYTSPESQPTSEGTIEGSISFPSEGIPKDLEVCIETIEGILVKCTKERINDAKYQYGVGYKIVIPEGSYFVYAKTGMSDYKAYYTEFVTCGLLAGCPSHQKIKVVVVANQTQDKIDPGDWYNQ